jgi:hypothetical protein
MANGFQLSAISIQPLKKTGGGTKGVKTAARNHIEKEQWLIQMVRGRLEQWVSPMDQRDIA